ncbi:hypothetical protein [Marinomonas colpomeniae]|uniref:DUF2214 family protein n=1 Tax=Marinomonas colpomeniae TaxID=2774408 RepID=A0ABR8NZR6_9GAMM|nr:hypothetical protein [Marinomonas colpomeniae]MBD5771536.1 hypothetical protein [Marinomonas colpomeniae]
MQIQSIVQWMSESALNHYIVTHSYVWPTLESLHFIGLCLLFGSLLLIDLRALGVAKTVPFEAVEKFLLVSITGFVINLSTGIAFIFGDPDRYFVNPSFQLKILCIVLALLNALYFSLRMKKHSDSISSEQGEGGMALSIDMVLPIDMKLAAGLSLVLWVAVIVFGRLIPYVE